MIQQNQLGTGIASTVIIFLATSDPPFSRIDLISCRNLLIYLEPVLQQRIMPMLHYALKPEGCLWLGGSETIGAYRNLFEAEDAKHKIYRKKPGSTMGPGHFPLQQGNLSEDALANLLPDRWTAPTQSTAPARS